MALNPLSLTYFDRFKRGDGMTAEQHAQALYGSPCVPFVNGTVEFIETTHGLTLKPSFVRQAVQDGTLPAYRIGKGFYFAPRDIDAWLESLRTSA
ncbi:helix-turn-helix domain-containing protein [Rhodococcus sp. LB1]|uniref:helix-turn-helix domain-containing protein n=1 Tax=Rhodococcus sp. LB1 TaxID=1807499 RepID=UPI00077A3E7D|nr:helix-turn-helix domain-containing protein [Rhodococcus sp. LB1]KXX62131.1 hypothetical protein AZG88_31010 [Rhodococcus sp. LB1]